MSGWTTVRDRIREQRLRMPHTRVLLVEGREDVLFFERMLDTKAAGSWRTVWCVEATDGKRTLLKILENESRWLGIVDRDEWSDSQIESKKAELPGLHVLPRFCLENYFAAPDELWEALPPEQQAKLAEGLAGLRTDIEHDLAQWVRHGALWKVVSPLWSGLRSLGFKDALLENVAAAQNDTEILRTLREWHAFLDPAKIMQEYQDQLARVGGMTAAQQLHEVVHGKMFFHQVVCPTLNRYLGMIANADAHLRNLITTCPLPGDLDALWREMGL